MKNRSELREIVMKILYQIAIYQESDITYNLDDLIKEQMEIDNSFVKDLVTGIIREKSNLQKIANRYLINWQIERLNKVDQAILNIGIYELLYTNTPSIVAINEAIELSKKYSDEKVSKMINATLDKIFHEEKDHE